MSMMSKGPFRFLDGMFCPVIVPTIKDARVNGQKQNKTFFPAQIKTSLDINSPMIFAAMIMLLLVA